MRQINCVNMNFNSIDFSLEIGRLATQANGSVLVRFGETAVLVTACMSPTPRESQDFFPLTVDYLERTYAAGKIPGGFFKREGKPSDQETLTSRLIDRAIRPLFPKNFFNEIQIIANVVSLGDEGNADSLAMIGASTALQISDIPFKGPIAGVRVAKIDGQLVINPSHENIKKAELNVFVAGSRTAILMVEGGAREINEEEMLGALMFGHRELQVFLDLEDQILGRVSKLKYEVAEVLRDEKLARKIHDRFRSKLQEGLCTSGKLDRNKTRRLLLDEVFASVDEAVLAEKKGEIKEIFHEMETEIIRRLVVEEGRRIDGRKPIDIREISCEIDFLPRNHGCALFTRGETQALVATTLGTTDDSQTIDSVYGEYSKPFMLHYNFPPFSVGEVKPLRNPGRREVGHGNLAERSLYYVLPDMEQFPYTIRIVSDILESNGSSSMATVCGGTLSLMACGVPILAPVAGIAMGLIKQGDAIVVLSDILGDEDHVGDMDFKIAGTPAGITAIQMDIKIDGVDEKILRMALERARDGRIHILKVMMETLDEPRKELSIYAPQINTIYIKPEKIKDLIGPGGKHIRHIIEVTKAKIDVDDSGKVNIYTRDGDQYKKTLSMIEELTRVPEIGKIYTGRVVKIVDFGAFVEILPGVEGLVHISQLADTRVNNIRDHIKEDDKIAVKVLEIDRFGKIRLSRKEAMADQSDERVQ